MKQIGLLFLAILLITGCIEDEPTPSTTDAKMNFQFKFDETQERLGSFGEPVGIPNGHAAPFPNDLDNQLGTLAGFIGFNTYISDFMIKNKSVTVDEDKVQGFWGFEVQLDEPYQSYYIQYANPSGVTTGQSPNGATTVVNILEQFGVTLPQGSCIVTGQLDEPLVITGNETENIDVTLSFSVNNSFEWVDDNGNGEWDWDVQAGTIEQVVDMGLRGLKVIVD